PRRDGWTNSPQELSIPRISSKRPLSKAWERYNDLLYKCPTHDINGHQKENIFYKGLSTMNRPLLVLQVSKTARRNVKQEDWKQ
ncbi:hypothetical protein Tco_0044985, partial [Tanacetum coccineum]